MRGWVRSGSPGAVAEMLGMPLASLVACSFGFSAEGLEALAATVSVDCSPGEEAMELAGVVGQPGLGLGALAGRGRK